MELFVVGYQQRVGYLSEVLHKVAKGHRVEMSLCCSMPARPVEITIKAKKATKKRKAKKAKRKITTICIKCNKECRTYLTDDHSMLNFIFRAVSELREEDEHLISGAVRMGFMGENVPEQPPIVKQQNVILVDGKDLTDGERAAMQEIENLDPIERQGLRLKLERKLLTDATGVATKVVKKKSTKKVKSKRKRTG